MANRVVHFEIEAKDQERAKQFYTTVFGWQMDQMGPDMGNYTVVKTGDEKMPGGINGGIYTEAQKELNAYSCVIGVDDVKKSIEDITKAGGKVLTPDPIDIPHVGLYVKCEDTEGNRFTLLQPSMESMEQK